MPSVEPQLESAEPDETDDGLEQLTDESDALDDQDDPSAQDQDADTDDEPESDDTADEADDDDGLGDTAQEPGTAVVKAGAPALPDKPVVEATPLTFRAGRESVAIDGAFKSPIGELYCTPQAAGELLRLAERGRHYETTWQQTLQQKDRDNQALRTQWNETLAASQITLQRFNEALSSREKFIEFVNGFEQNKQALLASIREQVAESKRQHYEQAMQRMQQGDPQENQRRLQEYTDYAIADQLDQIRELPQYKFLTDQDQQALGEELSALRQMFVIQSPQDYPEHGIRKGQWVINQPWFEQWLGSRVAAIQQYRSQQSKAQQAKNYNAQRLGKGKPKPRPVGSSEQQERPDGFRGNAWDNPKLSMAERRAAYKQHMANLANVLSATPG